MIVYRIEWSDDEPSAQTTDWATSRREADKIARSSSDDARVTKVEIDTSKAGLLAFLRENIWCDAGRAIAAAQDR